MASSSAPGTKLSALVVGAGSIGQRHLANLARLGVGPLGAVDPIVSRAEVALAAVGGGRAFSSLDEALRASSWDVAVVATPSSLHVEPATRLARAGTHLLMEKPLSDRLEGIDELLEAVDRAGVVAMMAMCYRFHPALVRIKQLLDQGAIGPVIAARCQGGYYLPWWHPDQDYRREYAAQARLGGGVLLTSIHTPDYVRWLFGDVIEVTGVIDRLSGLELDVEDVAAGLCRTERGVLVSIWMDFLERQNEHRIQIVGSTGDLSWSVTESRLHHLGPTRGEITVEELPADGIARMYVGELDAFLDAVRRRLPSPVPLEEGLRDLELVQAFRESAAEGRRVRVRHVARMARPA